MPIVSLAEISALPSHCEAGDTLFLDIDETLVSPERDASEPWAKAFADELQASGVPESAAWESACFIWCGLQGVCDAPTCEGAATRDALHAIVAKDVPIVGLTARAPDIGDETAAQLDRCGLLTAFAAETLGVLGKPDGTGPPLWHEHGVVFCNGARKPAGLLAYEQARGRGGRAPADRPGLDVSRGRVVFVDDRRSHLEKVQAAIEGSGRPFLGLHYERGAGPPAHAAPYMLERSSALLARVLATPRGRGHLALASRALGAAACVSPYEGDAAEVPAADASRGRLDIGTLGKPKACATALLLVALGFVAGAVFSRR